jgi:hypothetical protein
LSNIYRGDGRKKQVPLTCRNVFSGLQRVHETATGDHCIKITNFPPAQLYICYNYYQLLRVSTEQSSSGKPHQTRKLGLGHEGKGKGRS